MAAQMCSGGHCFAALERPLEEGRWDTLVDRRWDRDRTYGSATDQTRPPLPSLAGQTLKPLNQIPSFF